MVQVDADARYVQQSIPATATSSAADAEGPAPMGKCYHDTERALGGDRHALQLGLPVLAPNVSAGTTGFRATVGAFRK